MSTVVDSKTTLVALQGLRSANADINKASERLATGLRINKAGDDPAGFGKASALRAEIGSYVQVKKNINQALGDLDKVGGALTTISDFLVEMRSIALAASTETSSGLKTAYKNSFDELANAINDVTTRTKFSDTAVLSVGGSKTVQVDINSGDTKSLAFTTVDKAALGSSSLKIGSINLADASFPTGAMSAVDAAINSVSTELAKVGGYQRSLEYSIDLADANILSRTTQYRDIMDADLAVEATNLAAARIRQDASTAVLAQANSMNRTITDYLLSGAMG
jgi:flagellin